MKPRFSLLALVVLLPLAVALGTWVYLQVREYPLEVLIPALIPALALFALIGMAAARASNL